MTATGKAQKELDDRSLKVRSARQAAMAPNASERDKADLKLIEQDFQAAKLKARRSRANKPRPADATSAKPSLAKKKDRKLDAALKDSFPGSDPVSFLEAAPVKEGDRSLTSIKVNDAPAGRQALARKAK